MVNVIFLEIGIIIISAMVIGMIAKKLNQPLIPAYIVAGLILGPLIRNLTALPQIQDIIGLSSAISLIGNTEIILSLSEIGIAILLFIIGLEIDITKLREVGSIATFGALISIVILFIIGFSASIMLGFSNFEPVYIALILVFSSTLVVVGILSEKRQINTMHGRIIIGFLLVQDIVAIFALLFMSSLSQTLAIDQTIFRLIIGSLFLLLIIFLSNKLLPRLFSFAAKSKEILFLAALGTCFAYALIFNLFGFSIAIGAFIAGILLGSLPYHIEIIGRMKSLYSFFILFFFVILGVQQKISDFIGVIIPFFVILGLILIVKPVVYAVIMSLFGYKRKVVFRSTNTMLQVSEFSLILVTQGLFLNHVGMDVFSLTVMLAIVTITMTSYLSKYEEKLFELFKPLLSLLETVGKKRDFHEYENNEIKKEIILCGYHRIGHGILEKIIKDKGKENVLVIDYNPRVIEELRDKSIPYLYADVENPETLDRIDFSVVKILISTISDNDASLMLLGEAKKNKKRGRIIILTAQSIIDALELYKNGADYVIVPYYLSGDYAALFIEHLDLSKMRSIKKKHINELKRIHHEHKYNGV